MTAEDVTAEDVTAAIAEDATAVIVEDPKVVECAIGAETRIRPTYGCDCLYCGNTCENNSSTNKKKSKIKIENATLHEITQKSRGITVGPLNPTGVILIEGEEKPAKSMSGFIPDGTHVEVIKQDTFGLVVDRIRKS